MSKCSHESCKYWNKERESCFFFVESSGEVEDMPCHKENTNEEDNGRKDNDI